MRELPIIFSTPMVDALINDRKTMTRRTKGLDKINISPDFWRHTGINNEGRFIMEHKLYKTKLHLIPSYKTGDMLYVKEGHKIDYNNEYFSCEYLDNSIISKHVRNISSEIAEKLKKRKKPARWTSSMFLPQEFSRISLQITNIRLERLAAITNQDALQEGIEWKIKFPEEAPTTRFYRDYSIKGRERFAFGIMFTPRHSFFTLWDSINGKNAHRLNPWVWVYEFRRVYL